MIIVNTTFVLHSDIVAVMLQWIRDKYLASAERSCSKQHRPLLTKVLSDSDPTVASYAVHVYFDDMDSARTWCEGVGASMRKIITGRYGERALMFYTYLEVIE